MGKAIAGGGGISGLTLLGGLFIILKVTHNIDWSWWWVTSPFMVEAGLFVIGVTITLALLVAALIAAFAER